MEFNKEQTEVLQKALDTYGIDKQLDIAIEEMAELTKAIIKHRRYASRETYENLCEETADVAIMIEQIFLTTKRDDIAKYAVAKIDRLKQRLTAEKCEINQHIESCEDCGFCEMVGADIQ
jgi:NTP pyrophosphatase (non-canonical NTP hydrolase)